MVGSFGSLSTSLAQLLSSWSLVVSSSLAKLAATRRSTCGAMRMSLSAGVSPVPSAAGSPYSHAASHTIAARAAFALSWSRRWSRRMTMPMFCAGCFWTSERITTTASVATSSAGCELSTSSELTHADPILGSCAAHRPMARTVSTTNCRLGLRKYTWSSLSMMPELCSVTTCVSISSFIAFTALESLAPTKKCWKKGMKSSGATRTIVHRVLRITSCECGEARIANTSARVTRGSSSRGAR
mmetsp:Transcript_8744/g.28769  ORF Transcript_8744/g.28769 Transcript_8744/m.28769 type:complete len:242 (-) Transcript_8744:209-934(-)